MVSQWPEVTMKIASLLLMIHEGDNYLGETELGDT